MQFTGIRYSGSCFHETAFLDFHAFDRCCFVFNRDTAQEIFSFTDSVESVEDVAGLFPNGAAIGKASSSVNPFPDVPSVSPGIRKRDRSPAGGI